MLKKEKRGKIETFRPEQSQKKSSCEILYGLMILLDLHNPSFISTGGTAVNGLYADAHTGRFDLQATVLFSFPVYV